jgi:hypothetical protein
MKQKKIGFTVLLLLCLGITTLKAQQSANAAGGDATGTGGSASYSVGQVAYTSVTGSNGSSNQGVQQPYEFFVTGIDDYKDISLTVTVFPNPTQSVVNLKVESTAFENLSFQLYTVNGQLLASSKITEALTTIPMQALAAGPYLLRVVNSEKPLKSFTIIKNN